MTDVESGAIACAVPLREYPRVVMAHGGGGRLMHDLIERVFRPGLLSSQADREHDSVVLDPGGKRLAFTTDSYVVSPLFFPGGDIGRLAVLGTSNDLAMSGARPRWISCGFILEEGLPFDVLRRVVESMRRAADEVGLAIVTGDTKVVDRGKGDGLFINTAGIGLIEHGLEIHPGAVRPGDVCILSGDVGRHGIAIMNARENLELESEIESDLDSLCGPILAMLVAGVEIACLRDLTRGGLASALVEIAQSSGHEIRVDERAVPVREDVQGACEILGLDPLFVANEGRFLAILRPDSAGSALDILKAHSVSRDARIVGEVVSAKASGRVIIKSSIGVPRILEMLSGEQLPRIC